MGNSIRTRAVLKRVKDIIVAAESSGFSDRNCVSGAAPAPGYNPALGPYFIIVAHAGHRPVDPGAVATRIVHAIDVALFCDLERNRQGTVADTLTRVGKALGDHHDKIVEILNKHPLWTIAEKDSWTFVPSEGLRWTRSTQASSRPDLPGLLQLDIFFECQTLGQSDSDLGLAAES